MSPAEEAGVTAPAPVRLVCFGEVLVDLLAQPPVEGQPRAFAQYAGGAPANVAVAAARLGADAQFVGMLARDMFGTFLHDELVAAGVGVDHIVWTDQARTALAFVALDQTGDRSFSFYRPPAADLLFRASDFDAGSLSRADVFHFCSNSLTAPEIAEASLAGARLARQAGAVVSFDMNLRPALWPQGMDPTPVIEQALAEADVVKFSREELAFLDGGQGDGAAVVARLLSARARLIVVTDGPGAVRWTTRNGSGMVPSFEVTVRDTTAAGDAFIGGLLLRLVELGGAGQGLDGFCADPDKVAEAVGFGTAVGAVAVTRAGAFAAMPTRKDVLALVSGMQ